MYLKSKYGSGSFLQLAHIDSIDVAGIQEELIKILPIRLAYSRATETKFSIAQTHVRPALMATLFNTLETNQQHWKLASFGISESTMEQVFFNVAADTVGNDNQDDANADEHKNGGPPHQSTAALARVDTATGMNLIALQFSSVWFKRLKLTQRSKLGLVFQIVMPLVFVVLLVCLAIIIIMHLFENKNYFPFL